jgi:2-polyprenyl-6-methoxyphenol hydroxylase-like FAD-dependent oxidoreductase
LDFLAERAKRYPCFRLLMSAEEDGLIGEEGRVAGVAAKTKDGQLTTRADLTIGADGRHSSVRREAGFVPLNIGASMDALWFKLSRRTTDVIEGMQRDNVASPGAPGFADLRISPTSPQDVLPAIVG